MHTRVLRVKIYTAARACFSVHSGIPLSWSTGARASTDRPGDQPTDRPTDRPCPSHSRDTDTLHVPTLPSRYATLMSVQCVVEIATRLRTPTMGKRKAETPAQRTARLERETSEPLHTCASLSVSSCILGFHVRQFFSLVTSHKPLFTLSYISTTRAHCILDKTLIRTRNAYGGA